MIGKIVYAFLASISLFLCLAAPFLYFWGKLTEKGYRWLFLGASVLWFIFATLWASRRRKVPPSPVKHPEGPA
jgi:hypothetical protein